MGYPDAGEDLASVGLSPRDAAETPVEVLAPAQGGEGGKSYNIIINYYDNIMMKLQRAEEKRGKERGLHIIAAEGQAPFDEAHGGYYIHCI